MFSRKVRHIARRAACAFSRTRDVFATLDEEEGIASLTDNRIVIGYRLSVIGYRLSVIGHPSSAIHVRPVWGLNVGLLRMVETVTIESVSHWSGIEWSDLRVLEGLEAFLWGAKDPCWPGRGWIPGGTQTGRST